MFQNFRYIYIYIKKIPVMKAYSMLTNLSHCIQLEVAMYIEKTFISVPETPGLCPSRCSLVQMLVQDLGWGSCGTRAWV